MWFILVSVLVAVPAMACDKGCFNYDGVCACDKTPEQAPSVVPSDEKPPRSGMPSYQNPEVKAVTPPSLISDDEKQDQERTIADAQGKKAAGIQ